MPCAPRLRVDNYECTIEKLARARSGDQQAREELAEAKNAITQLGLKLEEVRDFTFDGATHSVIVLRKVKATPARFPRRFSKIKQAPL